MNKKPVIGYLEVTVTGCIAVYDLADYEVTTLVDAATSMQMLCDNGNVDVLSEIADTNFKVSVTVVDIVTTDK